MIGVNGSLMFEEEVDEGERIGGSLEDVGDEMKGIDTISYTFLCVYNIARINRICRSPVLIAGIPSKG